MKETTYEMLVALLGTLLFFLFILPFFMAWIPFKILSSPEHLCRLDLGAVRYVGVVLIASGVCIYVWCSINFIVAGKGSPILFTPIHKLIVTGLYRYVRNPMYIAGVLILTGEALLFQSIGVFIYCLAMTGIFNLQILMEETFLADRFGSTYEQYLKNVPRWVPRLKPYGDDGSTSP